MSAVVVNCFRLTSSLPRGPPWISRVAGEGVISATVKPAFGHDGAAPTGPHLTEVKLGKVMFKSALLSIAALSLACVMSPAAAAPSCPHAGFPVAEMTPSPATSEIHGGPRGKLGVRRKQFP